MNTSRSAFTLVEMLVVIALLTTLMGLGAAGMRVADNMSKETRTRSTIHKLNQFVMEKYASYQYRRVQFNKNKTRADKLYEIMCCEMPDHKNDVSAGSPYRLRNTVGGMDANIQSAELLYQIVMGLPEAESAFSGMEIADTNGNGRNEFVDGWGNPIFFIRWPAGHCNGTNGAISKIQSGTDPNPFDPQNASSSNYAVFPLIFSIGPDREPGINVNQLSGTAPCGNTSAGRVTNVSAYQDDITNHNL